VETLDVATTWERAEPLYQAVRRAAQGLSLVRAHFANAAKEGCAVELSLFGLAGVPASEIALGSREEAEADFARAEQAREAAWSAALAAVADEGATISHHSGVGSARQAFLRRELGDGIRQLRALKKAFDPHGILNPGKLLL
jgi:FAD/FMN-containing dehydrogenase